MRKQAAVVRRAGHASRNKVKDAVPGPSNYHLCRPLRVKKPLGPGGIEEEGK